VALGFGKPKKTDAEHVGTIVEECLRYVTRRVGQGIRDGYTGSTNCLKIGTNTKLVITLTHKCGFKIIQSLIIHKGDFVERSATAAAHKGVVMAKDLIRKIEEHRSRNCVVGGAVQRVAGQFGQAEDEYESGRINPQVARELAQAKKKEADARRMKCDICGETDDETYPPWGPCEHVQRNETASRKTGVENQRASKRARRPTQKVRRAKARAAKRQSAMDRNVRAQG
jgi:hypothetical protein